MKNFSNEAFAAYVAAFLDGEGSIILQKVRQKFYIRCVLTNTHKGVLDAINERLGYGNIFKKPKKNNRKICYYLCIDSFEKTEQFLRLIYPYLVIKKKKAMNALAIIARRQASIALHHERNRSILLEIENGISQVKIAKNFRVSQQTISLVKLGHTWPSRRKSRERVLIW